MEQFEQYKEYFNQHLDKKWYLAISGGVDSVVLLDLMRKNYPNKEMFIIHINHQLQVNANYWETFVHDLAKQHSMTCFSHRVSLKNSSEESARIARYEVFKAYLKEPALLIMGHHLDDSLETMLQRFFRGSRTGGLTGIPQLRHFEQGIIFRPLLRAFRNDILNYAQQNDLSWIEDPTNEESFYTRNFIRQKVLPLLNDHYQSLRKQLMMTQQMLADEHETLLDFFSPFIRLKEIDLKKLEHLSSTSLKTLIAYWVQYHQLSVPSYIAIEEFINQILTSSSDKHPILQIDVNCFIGYFQNTLYLENKNEFSNIDEQRIELPLTNNKLMIGNISYLSDKKFIDFFSTSQELLIIKPLTKKDEIMLNGKKIKVTNYWKEFKIPPWRRQSIPGFFVGQIFIQYGIYCYNKEIFEKAPFYCE